MNEYHATHAQQLLPGATTEKFFSLDEARDALPLVRRIMGDIMVQFRLIQRIRKHRARAAKLGRIEALNALENRGIETATRLRDLIRELESIGCEVCDPEQGYVHFPTLQDHCVARFCWKYGENTIIFQHDANGCGDRHAILVDA